MARTIRVGVMMCALREHRMIVPSIRQFDNIHVPGISIQEIIVACSKSSWYGSIKGDDTAELALLSGATVRRHTWVDEKDQKNWIIDKFQNMDWILLFAPDMFMTKASLKGALNYLRDYSGRGAGCEMITYWKDFDTIIHPIGIFGTFAIRPWERFEWSSKIEYYEIFKPIPGVTMHHLSWIRTDKEMEIKLKTWSHARQIIPGWYEEQWRDYTSGLAVHDPLTVSSSFEFKKGYLPDELRNLINKYQLL